MNRKRAILAIAVLIALIGGAVLVALLPRERAARHWTLSDGAKTMDVTLGVSKAVTVEFLAKPTLYKEAARRPTSR